MSGTARQVGFWVAALPMLAAAAAQAHGPVATVTAVGHGSTAFAYDAPEPGSYTLPTIRPAPDGRVLDSTGRQHSLHRVLAGRIVLLSFVYANCEIECPLATSTLFELHDVSAEAPELRANLKLVSLSFDPARDTPAAMAAFGSSALANPAGKSPWAFLTTSGSAQLAPLLQGFGQTMTRRPGGTINHLLRVYLIDRRGQVRNIYGLETLDLRLLLADVRTLLLEEAASLAGKP